MAPVEYAIPRGSLVLVTGANGYIGSHVVDQLLALDYKVRGTVRDKKPWLDEFFEKKYGKGKFESVAVQAIEDAGAFANVAEGASGVVHVVRYSEYETFVLFLLIFLRIGFGCLFWTRPQCRHSDCSTGHN